MESSLVRERYADTDRGTRGPEPGILYNRLALLGVVIYLLEFAFIIPFYKEPPPAGSANSEIAAFYAANRTDILACTAGVSVAILGVLLFAAALRDVLRQAGAGLPRASSQTSPSPAPSSPSRWRRPGW